MSHDPHQPADLVLACKRGRGTVDLSGTCCRWISSEGAFRLIGPRRPELSESASGAIGITIADASVSGEIIVKGL